MKDTWKGANNMFKFKRKLKHLTKESREKTQEFDVPSQLQFFTPMGGCRNIQFYKPEILVQFLKEFDQIVERFLVEGKVDEYNSGAFLDDYIDEIIELAKKDLQHQNIEHRNVIYSIKSIEQGYLLNYTKEEEEIIKYMEECNSNHEEEKEDEKKALQIYPGNVA